MLLEESLCQWASRSGSLADAIESPYQRVNEIVNGKRGITPSTALRLAKFFGMTPNFWMNLQRWDLYHAQQAKQGVLARIYPRRISPTLTGVSA